MTHDDPHSRAADPVHEGRPVEAQYVRQGRKGSRILLVLLVGLVLAVLGLLGFWALTQDRMADTNAGMGNQAVDRAAFQNDSEIPAADAPTTSTGEPTAPPTGEAPNVNAPTVARPAG